MRIPALNEINNIKSEKKVIEKKPEKNVATSVNVNLPAKNSLSEAIGRSQVVAFKGTNRTSGTNFIHKCSDRDTKEEINYDKKTGIFTHTVKDYDGNLILQEIFNPQSQIQDVIKIDEKGNTRRTYTTPSEEIISIKDRKGRDTYYCKNDYISQQSHEEITEYTKGRIIINDKNVVTDKVHTQVVDLKTKRFVTSGPLLIATQKDSKNNIYTTYNLITKQILKQEKYDRNDELSEYKEYSEKTGSLIRQGTLLNNGDWAEDEFRERYPFTLETRTVFAKNKKYQRVYEYEENGATEKSKTELRFKNASENSPVEAEIYYLLNVSGDIISTVKEYDTKDSSGKSYTYYDYNPNPNNNVPVKAQMVNDGVVIEDIKYTPNGKFFESTIEYLENGNRIETKYTGRNRKVRERQFNASNFMSREILYANKLFSDRIIKKYEFNERTGEKTETFYYDSGREKQVVKTSRNGEMVHEKSFRPDGSIEYLKNYSPDGSYEEKLYDENGQLIQTRHYNKYGERDDYYHNSDYSGRTNNSSSRTNNSSGRTNNSSGYRDNGYHSSYDYKASGTGQTQKKAEPETDEQLIDKISNYCASSRFSSITDNDWKELGRILDIEPERIKNLSHQDYRKLALKFHPDVNSSPESSKILCILNALEDRNNKK